MARRKMGLVAVAIAAFTVVTACGGDGGGEPSDPGGTADPTPIASPDEVIKVVDKGFVTYRLERPSGSTSDYLSYGFVVENVSDKVAVNVRAAASFLDEAGDPLPDETDTSEFSVVLPGQQMGVGGSGTYDGAKVADIEVKVTLISSLDTPDGARHRNPPAPYQELETSDPVVRREGTGGKREAITLDVTNTYDAPLKPKVMAVVRDADGVIVGGIDGGFVEQEIPPGETGQAEFSRDVQLPRLASGTVDYYADPMLGKVINRKPVWQDF